MNGSKLKRASRPRLTVITPVYNETDNLAAYVEAVESCFQEAKFNVRILFVDDGSTDNSWEKIEKFCLQHSHYSGLRLSRNFGAHVALAAGFDHVADDTDIVATLACDLQDPPETVVEFVEEWRRGADIVWGSRRVRADEAWRRYASSFIEKNLRRYAMPKGSKFRTGSFLLMDRVVLDCFRQYREHNRITFALVAWTGFNQTVVSYDRRPRLAGKSGWNLGQMLNAGYDVFIGFSPLPAKLVTWIGFLVFGVSIVALAALVLNWVFNSVQPGWTGLMASMTVFFGLLFMMIGMIAEYLYRIFIESKQRPLYFVARHTDLRSGQATDDE